MSEELLVGGELLVLTTDSVHGALDERHMERMLMDGADPADRATRLVETALARGSRDNCTAVVAQYYSE